MNEMRSGKPYVPQDFNINFYVKKNDLFHMKCVRLEMILLCHICPSWFRDEVITSTGLREIKNKICGNVCI